MSDSPRRVPSERDLVRLARLRREVLELEAALGIAARTQPEARTSNGHGTADEAAARLLVEHASDLLSIHAVNGDYLFASQSAERLFGYAPASLIGRNAYDLFHPDDLERIAADHASHSESNHEGRVRYRLRTASGEYRWVETTSRAHRDETGGITLVCITRDVDAEVAAQRRAADAERAATMGRLVGAIAHEITNPLTAALLGLANIEHELPRLSPGCQSSLTIATDGVQSAADVVTELRLLGGASPAQPQRTCVAESTSTLLALLRLQARMRLTLELVPAELMVDQPRLHQLLFHAVGLHTRHLNGTRTATVRCGRGNGGVFIEIISPHADHSRGVRMDLLGIIRGRELGQHPDVELIDVLCAELGATWSTTPENGGVTTRFVFTAPPDDASR